ncbi:uncharacterized protein LOC131599085 [Vicia villosa]|uniref:uncharacterized protein LOC131599085 n=1 Tax=Vicia villosa TaxID=3911 RepID=UPI00273AADE4|nr:uncharacterized protein LOC131599085 [Vicia villosa]
MDWFSWLSKTNLDPFLLYEYSLTFTRNELQLQDSIHFTHEFLQSMGISVAKHRLEILKLVNNQNNKVPKDTKKFSLVKCIKKCLSKLIFHEEEKNKNMISMQQEQSWNQGKWRRALVSEELKGDKGMHRNRRIAFSGPLDGRMYDEKMVVTNKSMLKFSGPLDGKMNERKMVYTNRSPLRNRPIEGRFVGATTRSPRFSGPISPNDFHCLYNKTGDDCDFEDAEMWRALFEDLKPT